MQAMAPRFTVALLACCSVSMSCSLLFSGADPAAEDGDGDVVVDASEDAMGVDTLSWSQSAYIKAEPASAVEDQFGYSISLSGDGKTLAVGTPYTGSDSTENSGGVHVYRHDEASGWWVHAKHLLLDSSGHKFGFSVSLDFNGTKLAVGIPALGPGAVYVYDSTSWEYSALPVPDVSAAQFGYSVALGNDGTVILVGAPYEDAGIGKPDAGAVYVFTYGTSWDKTHREGGTEAGDQLGYQVAINATADTFAVSAPNATVDSLESAGLTYIYDATWIAAGVTAPVPDADQRMGTALALSADGSRLAVASEDAPGVHIFNRDGTWHSTVVSAAASFEGASLALNGDGSRLVVGADSETEGDTGEVHVFHFQGNIWEETRIQASNAEGGDRSLWLVGLHGR